MGTKKPQSETAGNSYLDMELLRFTTAGSVDDGKSTLIGRLLYDSKSIFEDQLDQLEQAADLSGGSEINLANLTDGLRSEREQGITIDVAYRYFATPKRKFIIADTPGHVQYTRNAYESAGGGRNRGAFESIDVRYFFPDMLYAAPEICGALLRPRSLIRVRRWVHVCENNSMQLLLYLPPSDSPLRVRCC